MRTPVKVPGGWHIDYRDQFGKRYRYTYATKAQAQDELDTARGAVKEGTFVSPAAVPTFADAAWEWFKSREAKNRRPNTLEQYRTHLENHLLPELGALALNKIDVDRIERLRDLLLATPIPRSKKPRTLGAETVKKVLTTAGAVFKFAMNRKWCAANPAMVAERPEASEEITDEDGEVHRQSARAVTEDDILSADEIQKVLKHATEGLPYTLLLTAASTGARHNELLGLRWRDVDVEGGGVQIKRTLVWAKTEEGRVAKFYPPKTKAGVRRIPAPPLLVQAFRRWFLKSQHKAAGDLVFCTREGKPLHHRTVRRDVIERTRKRAKVRHFTMHSLRHTFASSLLQAGANIAEVQKYMGHKSAHVTLDVYTHFIPTADSGAVTAHVAKHFPNGQVLDTSAAPAAESATDTAVSA